MKQLLVSAFLFEGEDPDALADYVVSAVADKAVPRTGNVVTFNLGEVENFGIGRDLDRLGMDDIARAVTVEQASAPASTGPITVGDVVRVRGTAAERKVTGIGTREGLVAIYFGRDFAWESDCFPVEASA